jgi:hypothetical protein
MIVGMSIRIRYRLALLVASLSSLAALAGSWSDGN